MIILLSVLLTVVILALIHTVDLLAVLRPFSGLILVVAVLAALVATLSREALSKKRVG